MSVTYIVYKLNPAVPPQGKEHKVHLNAYGNAASAYAFARTYMQRHNAICVVTAHHNKTGEEARIEAWE